MTARDKAIIESLQRFRCMSRDDIADIHFSNVKRPIKHTNEVLRRLRLMRLITCDTSRRKYIYFPLPAIKEKSAKIEHYLTIVAFYRDLRKIAEPTYISVEPHDLGEGHPDPDIEMVWLNKPIMVEIQRSIFSSKDITEKMNKYRKYYFSEAWKQRPWQRNDREPTFPGCWMITPRRYDFSSLPFHFYQTQTVEEFLYMAGIRQKPNDIIIAQSVKKKFHKSEAQP